jgi:hypothetical protein
MELHLFYQEPDPDRWVRWDRYPRRLIRRWVRGPRRIGGQERVWVNLKAGLRKLGVDFRENDFGYARRNPGEPVGIVGKPCVLDLERWQSPILFGASVMSHPLDDPDLLRRLPVRRVLVPGEWMRRMCEPYWGGSVKAWPVGIDTDRWVPAAGRAKDLDVLIYNKVRWENERYEAELLEPIRAELSQRRLRVAEIRYGDYREEEFLEVLSRVRSMVFVCEHETQGLAYQEALSSGVPVLAWDRGGEWRDPAYHPDRVRFGPVSSVPYWSAECGEKFFGMEDFRGMFEVFWSGLEGGRYDPRGYVVGNLGLKECAEEYLRHWRESFGGGAQ